MSENVEPSANRQPTPSQLRYLRDRVKRIAASAAYYQAHKEERQRKNLEHYYSNQASLQAINLERYHRKKAEAFLEFQISEKRRMNQRELTSYFTFEDASTSAVA